MALGDQESVDRRTVLRAMGATAIAGLGVTGTAGADHVPIGLCARITHSVQSHGRGCLDEDPMYYFNAGDRGYVMKECVDNDGNKEYFFRKECVDPWDPPRPEGWVPHDFVEPYDDCC